ncbi:MAG: acyl carrier protein [Crocosphaera sp.]|nr:acyl carrier protein [Crocosphaera sp.]
MNQNSIQNDHNYEDIEAWLISYLSKLLEIEPNELDPQVSFNEYGLDSSAAVILTGDLQEWLKNDLDPTLLFDYPTIAALAEHLS